MHRAASLAAVLLALDGLTASVAAQAPDAPPAPDICLVLGLSGSDGSAITDDVRAALASRPILIPTPLLLDWAAADTTNVAVWAAAPDDSDRWVEDDQKEGCSLEVDGRAWSAAIAGEFLRAGTKRELAATPTTPGFTSSIDVEWDESTDSVRTVLTFSGPFDIPNGTCWLDDVVTEDGRGGTQVATTTGSRTSAFGDGVCGRFEDYLAERGGAGAQALDLLPRELALEDRSLRLRVDGVDVRADGVHLWGSIEQG
jgi:hypothetical protein